MYHKIRIRSPIKWPSAGEPISSNSISTSNREQRRSNVVPCILPNLVDRRQSRRSFCIRFTDENAWYGRSKSGTPPWARKISDSAVVMIMPLCSFRKSAERRCAIATMQNFAGLRVSSIAEYPPWQTFRASACMMRCQRIVHHLGTSWKTNFLATQSIKILERNSSLNSTILIASDFIFLTLHNAIIACTKNVSHWREQSFPLFSSVWFAVLSFRLRACAWSDHNNKPLLFVLVLNAPFQR